MYCNKLAHFIHGEDVNALHGVRGAAEASRDPFPDDLVASAREDVLCRGRERRVVLRLENPVALALNSRFAELLRKVLLGRELNVYQEKSSFTYR